MGMVLSRQSHPMSYRASPEGAFYTHVLNQGPAGVRSPAAQLDL